jgi:hypothetical protein
MTPHEIFAERANDRTWTPAPVNPEVWSCNINLEFRAAFDATTYKKHFSDLIGKYTILHTNFDASGQSGPNGEYDWNGFVDTAMEMDYPGAPTRGVEETRIKFLWYALKGSDLNKRMARVVPAGTGVETFFWDDDGDPDDDGGADAWQKKRKAAADARRRQKQKTEQAGAAGRRESAEMIEARSIQKATNNTIMLDCCKTAKETGCFDADMADLLKKNTMAALQASLRDKDNDDDDDEL